MASTSKLPMLVRSMSSAATASKMVKPPIQIFGIDGRYATALYSAANKQKQMEAVEKELVNFQKSMKTDARLKEFIENPSTKRKLKASALKALAEKMSLTSSTGNLLVLMAEMGRLKNLNGVINAYKTMMAAHRGEVVCEVTTAKKLDDSQRKQLEDVLKKFVQSNESILLTAKVDPAIIGGMIVVIGDRYVDMSVASKVKKYTEIISAAV